MTARRICAGRGCPNDREHAAWAYGGNAARLQVLKRRFDPDGIFASAIPLPQA
jgi:FAD/FMN-containing dehydrogenase